MVKIGSAQFHIMCEMWGVDRAIEAAKGMGMKVMQKQIATEREKEKAVFRRAQDSIASIMRGGQNEQS